MKVSLLCELELELLNTNPNGTEANAPGRSGNARALRKQSKCGMIQEGEGHWPNSSKNLQKARNLWVLRTPQNICSFFHFFVHPSGPRLAAPRWVKASYRWSGYDFGLGGEEFGSG